MTGNAQIDHRKHFNLFTLTTAGGQFESLQGVCTDYENIEGINASTSSQNRERGAHWPNG